MIRLVVAIACGLAIAPAAVADEPTQLAAAKGAIWTCSGAGVIELDARSGKVLRHAFVGSDYPLQVAVGSGAAWVAHVADGYTSGGLTRFDLASGRATMRLRLSSRPVLGVAAGPRAVWALTGPTANARVTRVDPASGRAIGVVRGVARPTSLAADSSGLWVATATGRLWHGGRIVTGAPARRAPLALALGGGSAWAAGDGVVVRVDERTSRPLATLHVAGIPVAAAAGREALWLLVVRRREWLVRVDAGTNRVTAQRRVPKTTTSISVGAGGVWLGTAGRLPRVMGVDPRTLALHQLAELF
jgi:hypothetical protein